MKLCSDFWYSLFEFSDTHSIWKNFEELRKLTVVTTATSSNNKKPTAVNENDVVHRLYPVRYEFPSSAGETGSGVALVMVGVVLSVSMTFSSTSGHDKKVFGIHH